MGTKKSQDAAKAIKDGIASARSIANKAARQGLKKSKEVAAAAGEGAVRLKHSADEKIRLALDNAYETKHTEAQANLKRLRRAKPDATPAEIMLEIEKTLKKTSAKSDPDSEAFATKVSTYVLTAAEIHPATKNNASARQKLIDSVVVLDSPAVKIALAVGGAAGAVLMTRFKFLKPLAKLTAGAAMVQGVLSQAGLKNPKVVEAGKSNVFEAVIKSTRTALGKTPAAWPTQTPTPGARKPAVQKATSKKAT